MSDRHNENRKRSRDPESPTGVSAVVAAAQACESPISGTSGAAEGMVNAPDRSRRKVQTYVDMLERFLEQISRNSAWRQTGIFVSPFNELTGNESEPDLWHLVGHHRFVAMLQTYNFFRDFLITSDRSILEYERQLELQKRIDAVFDRLRKLDQTFMLHGATSSYNTSVTPNSASPAGGCTNPVACPLVYGGGIISNSMNSHNPVLSNLPHLPTTNNVSAEETQGVDSATNEEKAEWN
eukprot:GHVL01044149.1.p1 GENE.GHVL01044149.1~~GHVL01044149.1.p1  ORF type:complete len:238 (+),score=30.32 GHVL01044149.1:87-800(+)